MERIVDFRGIGITLVHLAKTKPPFLWPKAIRALHTKEDVVRCKDCRFYSSEPWLHYNDSVTYSNCFEFQDYEGTPAKVNPDGFCAWGEPRGER